MDAVSVPDARISEEGNPSLAMDIARVASAVRYDDLPDAVQEKARVHLLDTFGLALASLTQPFAAPSIQGIIAAGAPGRCVVLGTGHRLSARDAAMANGLLMHGLDFDDTHMASIIHASVASLPAALSLGEHLDVSWKEMLVAYVVGMEVAIRIGAAVKGGFHEVGFHATGVVSHFSSATVAGRLLGLTASQICAAQGIAASTAAGVQVFLEEGAWTKRLHPGWGALSGITAAYMAQAGFLGPSRPYEGKFGLFETHLHGARASMDAISVGLGSEWRMLETAIKPYPICHFNHACVEASIRLSAQVRERLGEVEEIIAILPEPTLHIVAEPAFKKQRVTTDYEAKFSVQYGIAASLVRGKFGMQELSPESILNPQFAALAARVRCQPEEHTEFPKYFSGKVTVRFSNGDTLSEHIPVNLGAGSRPLSWDQVSSKFLGTAGLLLGAERSRAALDIIGQAGDSSVREVLADLAAL
ncbi:MmgE/PrpD family protein [Castellaniella sp.]|uniref:MmgE/PrpD family protein n=1 Tax=Castellaniella sp. TaxID=1955812 RepID=UPI00356065A3